MSQEPACLSHTLTVPSRRLSPEAGLLGEARVAVIDAHLQRHPAMSWAEV